LRHNIVTHSMMAARSRAICSKCYEVPSCTDFVRCEVVSWRTNVFRRPSARSRDVSVFEPRAQTASCRVL